jgi:hypothetical protein
MEHMTTDELLQRWSDGSITADELRELTAKLAKPEHQSALLDDWLLESSLPDRLPGAAVAGLQESAMNRRNERIAPVRAKQWAGWFSWRPLTAAAAGIVFGMFCTSVAFAYVAPSLGKMITLLQESFESGPAPLVTGVPPEPNVWSGDYSEIVLESEGVKPEDGWKMARLLRSDYEGRTEQGRSQQGDLMRVIDVRPYLGQSKSADVVMTLSAHFNAVPFPAAEHYQGLVMIYALDADKELPGTTEWDIEKNALAQCIGKCDVDRDPATWQAASTRLLLPAGTAFVMLKASMARKPGESEKLSSLPKSEVFAGHFVDGVDASILIRDAVPDHRTQASTHVAQ